MPDLFKEVLPSILRNKKNVFEVTDCDYKTYGPFMTNRALSYHMDCIMYVNCMNTNFNLAGDMQYEYLMKSIRSMERRFQPWIKKVNIAELDMVKEYFSYSSKKAIEAMKILTKDDLKFIKEKTDKGGKKPV